MNILVNIRNYVFNLNNSMNVLTACLVLITAYYAFVTHQMAEISAKQLATETTPYAGFDKDISIETKGIPPDYKQSAVETDYIKFSYNIINFGKVPLKYIVNSDSFNGINQPKDLVEAVLYPGQTMIYNTSNIAIPNTKLTDLTGTATIGISYWGLDDPSHKYFSSRSFSILNKSYRIIKDEAGNLK